MEEIIVGLFSILIGCLMVVFHKPFARFSVKHQNKFWGFHFGDREVKATGIISMIVGIGFIIFGFLAILHIGKFR